MKVRVNFEDLARLAKHFQDLVAAIQAELRQLEGKIEPLLSGASGAWQGESSMKYVEARGEWQAAEKKLDEAAIGFSGAITQTSNNFMDAEAGNIQRIARAGRMF